MNPQLFVSVALLAGFLNLILLSCAYLILLERKVAAWAQDRIGPNRVNFSFGLLPFKGSQFGLGQALVDGIKLLVKEDYTPPHVDTILFTLAPVLIVVPAVLGWAIIPWGGYYYFPGITLMNHVLVYPGLVSVTGAAVNIGIVYILAVGSLAVYGVVIGGYASNNKYSFLGGLRATAQMLSYEIPQALCVLVLLLITGSARADYIVAHQVHFGANFGIASGEVWNLFQQPLLAVIFFICILAECNRAPFDLAEAEQELVGGYHTEYSSMKWALFFLGEYMHMITGAAFFTLLFLGGWSIDPLGLWPDLPFVAGSPDSSVVAPVAIVLAKIGVYIAKVAFLLFAMMWIRWTLPRFRFDQLMRLAWRSLIPIMLVILLFTGILVHAKVLGAVWYTPWWYLALNVIVFVGAVVLGPLIPQGPPVNRRVPLEGSRFNPPAKPV